MKMKKVALSLAGVMAAAAFAPEASALPVFARQTGMACSACHFQHFPILNSFGRSFKASGYTLMGAQGKVEGDDLSIPDRLNMAVLTTAGIEQETGAAQQHNIVQTPGNGGELSLFFGGRVSENIGFLTEIGQGGTAAMSAAKLPFMYEVADNTHAGIVFMTTSGQGPSHSFEILNTGATAVHLPTPMPGAGGGSSAQPQHFAAASAAQYLGIQSSADGASLVVVNPDSYFINVGRYGISSVDVNALGGANSNQVQSTYLRGALIDIAGSGISAGVQAVRGNDGATPATVETKMTVVDAQWMTDIGGNDLIVIASYGTAPAGSVGKTNLYNQGGAVGRNAHSLNIAASYEFMHGATVFGALRSAKNGSATGIDGDNAVQIGATYALAQNVELSLTNTSQSGSSWNVGTAGLNAGQVGKNATSLKVEALF